MNKEISREYLFKEVEIVQNIILRLENMTLIVRMCSVTLITVALLFGLGYHHYFIAFALLFVFWVYDAHLSRLDKLYRTHYECLVNNRLHSMCSLNVKLEEKYRSELPNRFQVMFSKILVAFYGFLLIIIVCSILVDIFY